MHQNGARPHIEPQRLRWLWLGGSILSDRDDPLVVTNRLVIRDLVRRGQEIEYLEPANHPAFLDRLRDEGSGFYRSFLEEFPEIRYRRYDMPRAHERDVWLSREAALVDAIMIEAGAPPEIFAWLDRVEEHTMVRILLDGTGGSDRSAFDLVIGPNGPDCRYDTVETVSEVEALANQLLAMVISARASLVPGGSGS